MATHETAPDQFLRLKGLKIAYRLLGPDNGVPLIYFSQFRGTMDGSDPLINNELSKTRRVILFDNVGVGESEGSVPTTYKEWADNAAEILKLLGISIIDVYAFSMGGAAAQMLAINYPKLVRRLVLCGSFPSIGPGVDIPPKKYLQALRFATTFDQRRSAVLYCCFCYTERSLRAGLSFWERMVSARKNWAGFASLESSQRQTQAYQNFFNPERSHEGSFMRLDNIHHPTLIVRGEFDEIVTDKTAQAMIRAMSNSHVQYHIFEAAGHAPNWQYPLEFSKRVNNFLSDETVEGPARGVTVSGTDESSIKSKI